MNLSELKIKIIELHRGWESTAFCGAYDWDNGPAKAWVLSYIKSNPAELRGDQMNGLECSPEILFSRISENIGYSVKFKDDGKSFIFEKMI